MLQLAKAQGIREESDDDFPPLGSRVGRTEFARSTASARGMFSRRSSDGTQLQSETERVRDSGTYSHSGQNMLEEVLHRENSSRTVGHTEFEFVVGDMVIPVVGEA